MTRLITAITAVPQELISAVKWGYLFQGQFCKWQQKLRGTCTFGIPAPRFVTYLENHDQVANSARGLRLEDLTSPARYRAMAALWLLAPQTPLLFQGQELGSSRPFLYFADHTDPLANLIREGRRQDLAGFRSTTHPDSRAVMADPMSRHRLPGIQARRSGGLPRKPDVPAVPGPAQAPSRGPDLPSSAFPINPRCGARSRGVRPPLSGRRFERPAASGQPGPRSLSDTQLRALAGTAPGHAVVIALVQRAPAL